MKSGIGLLLLASALWGQEPAIFAQIYIDEDSGPVLGCTMSGAVLRTHGRYTIEQCWLTLLSDHDRWAKMGPLRHALADQMVEQFAVGAGINGFQAHRGRAKGPKA